MRAWPVRILLVSILVGSLAAKVRTPDVLAEDHRLEAAIIRVAQSGGLTFHQNSTISGTDIRTLVFDAEGCSQPVLIALLSLTFAEEPTVRSTREPGYALKYFYIERSWADPPRLTVYFERVKYVALAMLGLTQFTPSRQVLLVESPPRCSVASDINWQGVWQHAPPSLPDLPS
jgi:hypothetical protein